MWAELWLCWCSLIQSSEQHLNTKLISDCFDTSSRYSKSLHMSVKSEIKTFWMWSSAQSSGYSYNGYSWEDKIWWRRGRNKKIIDMLWTMFLFKNSEEINILSDNHTSPGDTVSSPRCPDQGMDCRGEVSAADIVRRRCFISESNTGRIKRWIQNIVVTTT